MSSLGYAERKTRELGLTSITHAQADLLKLQSLNRRFDIIESAGLLHHLASPWTGGKILASLLRPGGFLKLGLYSEAARRHVVEVRKFIGHQGYQATAPDIRRFREGFMDAAGNASLISLLGIDFFTLSGCRDLLFHVQDHHTTLAEIETFLLANDMTFLGFDIRPAVVRSFKGRFPTMHPRPTFGSGRSSKTRTRRRSWGCMNFGHTNPARLAFPGSARWLRSRRYSLAILWTRDRPYSSMTRETPGALLPSERHPDCAGT